MNQPKVVIEARRFLRSPANRRLIEAFEVYNSRGVSLTAEQWEGLLARGR